MKKKILILSILLLSLCVSYTQNLKNIINAYEGIFKEEMIDIISMKNNEEEYIMLPINIKTPSFNGKVCIDSYQLYQYYNKNQNRLKSFLNVDSCYLCFLNKLLLLNDTLNITELEFENHFLKNKIITNYFADSLFVDKENFLKQFFNENGSLKQDSFHLVYELVSILNEWNIFMICGEDITFSCDIINFSGECSFNDVDKHIEHSFNMFLSHFNNYQEFILDSYSTNFRSIKLSKRYGIENNYIREKDFNKKYIEFGGIQLCYDQLIISYHVVSYIQGSTSSIYRVIVNYSGSFKYKYNPKLRRYIFVEEEFIEY